MFGAVKLEGDRLIDGYRDGFRRGVTVVTSVNGDRLSLHSLSKENAMRLTNRSGSVHFALLTGTEVVSREADFASARVTVRAANPAPNANRMTGPKLLAAATPAK